MEYKGFKTEGIGKLLGIGWSAKRKPIGFQKRGRGAGESDYHGNQNLLKGLIRCKAYFFHGNKGIFYELGSMEVIFQLAKKEIIFSNRMK